MKSIIVSSNCSGGGKTTVTLALMRNLIKRGYDVQGYKVGPDYIDSAFHGKVTGKPSRNLDIFLMGTEGVKESYLNGNGNLGVIEGVMGLYDGKGLDTEFSTAHVARTLDLPVVLVMTPKAQSVTLCAEIKGLLEFENVNIVGVILNNVTEAYYKLLKAGIELNCSGVKVFGYVPNDSRISLESRHLGLVQSSEVEDLLDKIEIASKLIEEHVDMDSLVEEFKEAEVIKEDKKYRLENKNLKIAVAYDEAFSFYYKENLELLEQMGDIYYFSPLCDEKLPENIDFLYIGGGYPEVYKEKLTKNKSMLDSIYNALDAGVRCYAECGGLMYLTKEIDGCAMVGFLDGRSMMTKKLNNFGYGQVEVISENHILPKGLKVNCHEFHKSIVELNEQTIYRVKKELYDGSIKEWNCGYAKKNTLAAYAHIHFFSNLEFIKSLLKCNK